jgi:hypothetical protein
MAPERADTHTVYTTHRLLCASWYKIKREIEKFQIVEGASTILSSAGDPDDRLLRVSVR